MLQCRDMIGILTYRLHTCMMFGKEMSCRLPGLYIFLKKLELSYSTETSLVLTSIRLLHVMVRLLICTCRGRIKAFVNVLFLLMWLSTLRQRIMILHHAYTVKCILYYTVVYSSIKIPLVLGSLPVYFHYYKTG